MTDRAKSSSRLCEDDGFTLLEVLISTVLLAFIFVSMQSALRFGQSTWEIADDIEHIDRDAATLRFIEQRLVQVMPLYGREQDGRLRVAFVGTHDKINFIAPAPAGQNGGGLYKFELSTAPQADGRDALTMSTQLYQPFGAPAAQDQRVLIPGVENFSLRYLGRLKSDGQPAWTTEWSRTEALPDVVELRFSTQYRRISTPTVLQIELRLRPPA